MTRSISLVFVAVLGACGAFDDLDGAGASGKGELTTIDPQTEFWVYGHSLELKPPPLAWDPLTYGKYIRPDPYIRIRWAAPKGTCQTKIDGTKVEGMTYARDNTYNPTWAEFNDGLGGAMGHYTLEFLLAHHLCVEVLDDDGLTPSDKMGDCRFALTEQIVRQGELVSENCDLARPTGTPERWVTRLTLKFGPVERDAR
ncbi:MAG: hypothetical protein H6707_18715 [Deltaproteobacteria bacterium]|nr:hypothetical protein [Deltaproteobacteria bacterium]